jgi:parallel beta-helix repeat protein
VILVLLAESGPVFTHAQLSVQKPTTLYQGSSNSDVGTLYVSTTGNDNNAGTSSSPWRTIQKAANTLTAGQTVLVQAGTYSERVGMTRSGSSGSIITFQAQGTVVMMGFNIQASYVKVDGFEIANTAGTSPSDRSNGSGVYLAGSNNVISNNYLHHTTAAGIYLTTSAANNVISGNRIAYGVECGIYVQGTNNLIDSNDISHTRSVSNSDADGIRFFGTGNIFRKNYIHDIILSDSPGQSPHIDGFQTWGPTSNLIFEQNIVDHTTFNQCMIIEGLTQPVGNIIIRNNIFMTGKADGYSPSVLVGDMGLVTSVTIVNNDMVALNGPVEFAVWLFPNARTVVVRNNVMYDHGNSGEPYIRIDSGASGLDIGSNAIFKSDNQMPKGGCLVNDFCFLNPSVSPGFVNAAANDFHLQSTSPLIDRGVTLPQVTGDFDGVARPRGGGYEIGAFEYLGELSPTRRSNTS